MQDLCCRLERMPRMAFDSSGLCLMLRTLSTEANLHCSSVLLKITCLNSYEKSYKLLELLFHRDIQTLENNGQTHSRYALVFSPLFSRVWISR